MQTQFKSSLAGSNSLKAAVMTALLAVALVGTAVSHAAVLPPQPDPYGKTYGEWEAEWQKWAIGIPADHHPLTDTADCSTGQSGSVWFIGGSFISGTVERHCTVPVGKALFFPLLSAECSTVEPDPFHGDTEEEMRACAKSFVDPASDLFCIVDGKPVKDLDQYRVASPLYNFSAPEPNVLFVPGPVSGQSVSDGFWIMLSPLAAGQHILHFGGTFSQFDFTLDITYHITVQ